MRQSRPGSTERGDQHCHHDRTQAKHRPFHRRFDDVLLCRFLQPSSPRAELVDVFKHDYARLHRYPEQRQESDRRRHREIRIA